jgi:hypothetical protein
MTYARFTGVGAADDAAGATGDAAAIDFAFLDTNFPKLRIDA